LIFGIAILQSLCIFENKTNEMSNPNIALSAKEYSEKIWDSMKGFRITKKHQLKCSLKCVSMLMQTEANYGVQRWQFWNEVENNLKAKI